MVQHEKQCIEKVAEKQKKSFQNRYKSIISTIINGPRVRDKAYRLENIVDLFLDTRILIGC